MITKTKNVNIILSKKANPGKINLKTTEIGMVNNTDHSAAVEVVRFQKSPSKKIHNTPGVTKPVYS